MFRVELFFNFATAQRHGVAEKPVDNPDEQVHLRITAQVVGVCQNGAADAQQFRQAHDREQRRVLKQANELPHNGWNRHLEGLRQHNQTQGQGGCSTLAKRRLLAGLGAPPANRRGRFQPDRPH